MPPTSEAYHMVVPKEDGAEIAKTMRLALDDAQLRPGQVDYVNAHATSTMVGRRGRSSRTASSI